MMNDVSSYVIFSLSRPWFIKMNLFINHNTHECAYKAMSLHPNGKSISFYHKEMVSTNMNASVLRGVMSNVSVAIHIH